MDGVHGDVSLVIQYKQGKENIVPNALSRRVCMKMTLDFFEIYNSCDKGTIDKCYKHEGYLFQENRLCIPNCSMRELLVREAHSGGLIGHFRMQKTLEMLGMSTNRAETQARALGSAGAALDNLLRQPSAAIF
ncbi:uncharacterized protein LOC111366704 [Olea europaea var. sylvestris]|uniref:uncharacterized protein LOC111366704 n=1 Tax=Olea europaea var. sylvestris TaxID=158386 RepID=UPI000C1D3B44|nr:uncharacterized protein LOC111366704 [Olea europaea var. sylvestris]